MATMTAAQNGVDHTYEKKSTGHYKDWPNVAGFNALGDTRTRVLLKTTGSIPSYAAGKLYRTGPGGHKISRDADGDFAISHWFDGFTTVHKFDIVRDANSDHCSQIWYSSYSHVDEAIEQARKSGRLDGISFGQKRDPCDSFYRKVKAVFAPQDFEGANYANIGVAFRDVMPAERASAVREAGEARVSGRRLLNLTTDAQSVKQFDADTLEPLGVTNQKVLHPALTGQISAAHAAKDPDTGDIFNFNLSFGPRPTYKIFRATPEGKVTILASLSGSDFKPAYLHSLHLTPNFVVLCIWPAFFTAYGASILWNRNILDSLAWDDKAKTTWCVIDRHHGCGLVKLFHSDAFFCFHSTNAWEEQLSNGEIDIVCEQFVFSNMDVLHSFYYKYLTSDSTELPKFDVESYRKRADPRLTRHRLSSIPLNGKANPLKAKTELVLTITSPHAGDLQRCNPNYTCKPHRYVWAVLQRGKASFLDGLVKTDIQTQTSMVWECARHTPSEPVFVPAPHAVDEDDGVILSVVLDGDQGSSYLLCLDARTMVELGRAEMQSVVGFGFHGLHLHDDGHQL